MRVDLILAAVIGALPCAAAAQSADGPPGDGNDIVVVGKRGQVRTDAVPIASLDAAAIAGTGVTSLGDLLNTIKGATQGVDGQPPIFLLNAQRVSGDQEIFNLPPEAIEKVDVLPESVALQYGYPPTRRVVNFVTKKNFRQLAIEARGGTSTRGGAGRERAHLDLTRLADSKRLTLSLDARHTDALRQLSRQIAPDPDVPFDARGNVTGLGATGEVDPALSALAGQVVTIAPVPLGAPTPGAFAAGANMPRLFDLSPLHDLAPSNTTYHAETVLADKLGKALAGSLTLTADHSRERTLYGPASATLIVPAGNPASPFGQDVALQRYLTEAPLLGSRTDTTTLHAGVAVRGAWRGWQWDATGTLDEQRRTGVSGSYIDTTAANAAIAAGADPFAPLAPTLVQDVVSNRTTQETRGAGAKVVASKGVARLPAGAVTLTTTVEGERTSSHGVARGPAPSDVSFARTRVEGRAAIDLPIASRREQVLAGIGDLSANASATVRHVGGFGDLSEGTAGLTWQPFDAVQVLGQYKLSAAAPTLDQLAAPQTIALQVPIFDFATGRSEIVTYLSGGNPDLRAERRREQTLGVTVKPFAQKEVRVSATYAATTIRDGAQSISALTPATLAALPDLFVRDASGQLTTVIYRPTNIGREEQRTLNLTLDGYTQLGHAPPTPDKPDANAKPPERAVLYAGLGPTIRFSDRVTLRPGTPALDLVDGDTLTGGTSPRIAGYGYFGVNHYGNGGTFDFYCTGEAHLRGAVAAADLDFAPLCKVNLRGSLSVHHFFPHAKWTSHLGINLEVENVTDAHQGVRAADGSVPYRYQPDLIDPIGRVVSLVVRKRF